jgi:glycosyltransferase involved in cell wall biosynthesis
MIFFVSSFFIPLTLFKIWDELPASILKVGWAGDLFGQEMKERADQLDHLYCSDSSFVERAVQYGFKCTASLLPHAFNPRIFTSDAALPRRNELLFIGSYSFQRASICQQIQIPCRIIGPKWSRMPGSVHLIESRKIPLQKVAELYLGTRSVLNIQSFDNVINGLNMRTFEAAGCGAAVLNDYLTDLPELFEPEREILTYRSIDELNEYAQKLHNDETFTKTLAEAGRKRAEREHTYRHRAKQIVNDLF